MAAMCSEKCVLDASCKFDPPFSLHWVLRLKNSFISAQFRTNKGKNEGDTV